ncbi:rod shape-determining protein MreD [Periweissella beninensis]|uniref:Rod shape-determining protein MreD n=1 Tax=Periweissella beninensis TaxID=504936 RepID=A0ABT0VH50_9LACO|nr:rod shape-determining protein MreD [Periweissella beninensis]MBM7543735.1 rod shape-determining protein MreD [Periweissella beninensis]MCM2436714.1 rod shape-determining protein MreD [Periweissella beninensis]MCT4395680.1 rod shape-determining protein MreD [Periweissella beninensis]
MFGFFGGYHTKLKWIFPIMLFLLLFLDGAIYANMAGILTKNSSHTLPMFVALWLIYAITYELDEYLPIYLWTLVAGIIYDVFYFGVIGGYTVGFLILVWVCQKLRIYLSESLLSVLMITILGLTSLQLFTYLAANIAGLSIMTVPMFVLHTFTPTLALNVVMAVIMYVPCRYCLLFLKNN